MWGNALIVASLLTRSRDPSPLLRHPSVYSCCLATNEERRCDAMRDSSRFGSARRKHRFVYCCVIAGACFDVTVLAWRKYATIYIYTHTHMLLLCCYMFRPYKAIFRQHLYGDTNSLYANRIIFLRNVVDVLSYLFEFRLFLCHIGCVVCIVRIKRCLAFLVYKEEDYKMVHQCNRMLKYKIINSSPQIATYLSISKTIKSYYWCLENSHRKELLWKLLSSEMVTQCALLEVCQRFGRTLLRNVSKLLQNYMALYPWRLHSSWP
jgi:hypothetical protein